MTSIVDVRYIEFLHALVSFAGMHPDCPVPVAKVDMLARIAMHDIAVEGVTGHRKRRKYAELGRLFGVTEEVWLSSWHGHYVYFRGLFQALPGKSLPGLGDSMLRLNFSTERG